MIYENFSCVYVYFDYFCYFFFIGKYFGFKFNVRVE